LRFEEDARCRFRVGSDSFCGGETTSASEGKEEEEEEERVAQKIGKLKQFEEEL
jgi:hypothetical protein